MKLIATIILALVFINSSFAQKKDLCNARVKSFAMREAQEDAVVTLDVNCECDLTSPKLDAYLGRKKVSKNSETLEVHTSENLKMYSFTVSKDVAKKLDQLTFRIKEKGSYKKVKVTASSSLFKKAGSDANKIAGSGRVKKISQSVVNGNLQLKVKVTIDVNLSGYPDLIASINGIDLNKYTINYYGHPSDETQEYIINMPSKYESLVKDMSFRIVESNQRYLEVER
ncbi:MAG: hypothetical protein ACI837_002829 [Crocinitomicaceae bacterium]|jgi:hypothetical protein